MRIAGRLAERRKKVFYGWWITAAGTLTNAIGVGFYFYGWSTFFKSLETEFGWSRAVISGVSSLSRLEGGLEGPVVGFLIDRLGARRLILFGATITGLGFMALWFVDQNVWKLYVIFGILAFGYNSGFSAGTTAAVAKWFIRARSRALSILTTGNSVGGAVLVPLVAWFISQYGWRSAAVFIGAVILAVVIPLTLFVMRSTPEEMGMVPDGLPGQVDLGSVAEDGQAFTEVPGEVNLTWREALRTQAFWMFTLSMLFRASILSSIVLHQQPYLQDVGFSSGQAASVLALMVLFSAPGRLGFGWAGDYVNKKWMLFALCAVQALGIFIFIHARTMPMLYLFAIVYGPSYGGVVPLTTALRADLFGRREFATINGIVSPITSIGGILGPLFAGYMYDVTGSYTVPFYTFMALIFFGGVFFLFIKDTRPAPGGVKT